MTDPIAAAHTVALRQHGALTAAQARACGLSRDRVAALVRSGAWTRVVRGVYVVPAVVCDEVPAWGHAAVLAAPAGAVCSHALAARLWRLQGLPALGPATPLDVIGRADLGVRRRPRLVVHRHLLVPAERTAVDGIPVTAPLRTLADLAATLPREPVVSAADSALATGLVTPDDLAAYADSLPRRRAAVLRLADGRSESPLESRARLVLLDGGLPAPVLQHPVFDGVGVPYAWLDLAYPAHRVGLEADGREVHGRAEALYADRRRQNRLLADGWLVLRFTWDDVVRRPSYVQAEVRRALRSRGWRG